MTVADAAHKVLTEAGQPLHYEEITRRILLDGLWNPKTKTPSATVGAQIYTDLKKKGSASRFVATGKGIFRANGVVPPPPSTPVQPPTAPATTTQTLATTSNSSAILSNVSFADAAAAVLDQYAERQPMHYRDIAAKALSLGLITTQGQTPEATLRASIYIDIQRQEKRGEQPRFFRLPKGLVGLTRWKGRGDLPAQIEQHNQQVGKKLHEKLLAMPPTDFEILVAELLVKIGFQTTVTKPSGDGGIDVRGTLVVGDVIRTRMAVQVKRWKNNVQTTTVQQVRGSLGAHEQGLIITTSDFSPGARKEAARPDAVPVALMNGDELVKLLMENELGVQRSRQELFELAEVNEE